MSLKPLESKSLCPVIPQTSVWVRSQYLCFQHSPSDSNASQVENHGSNVRYTSRAMVPKWGPQTSTIGIA